jgi:FlaG/FlaF family flagellin (archaellin)
MSKGISTIIAVILLLIITIALSGTAYMFITNLMGSRMEKVVALLDSTCNNNALLIVLRNDGTKQITSNDLKILVNNVDRTSCYPNLVPINPGTSIASSNTTTAGCPVGTMGSLSGSTGLLIVSPSNSVRVTIWC